MVEESAIGKVTIGRSISGHFLTTAFKNYTALTEWQPLQTA